MLHDGGQFATWVAVLAYVTLGAATGDEVLGGEATVAVAASAGLMGGFLSTLWGVGAIRVRDLTSRMIASGMVSPALVIGSIYLLKVPQTVALVLCCSGIAGLAAYPIAQIIPKMSVKWFKELIKRVLGVSEGKNDGP